ncbi:MAG: type II secretion system F family protein [Gammaproteobacteria bacterium]|nr:type II secretion system F family protein [Gammaproteobacteria bacterium]
MAFFKYRAVNTSGKVVDGVMELASAEQVVEALGRDGLMAMEVTETRKPAAQGVKKKRSRKKSNERDRVLHFTRELAVMLSSGLPLDRSLSVLEGLSDEAAVELIQHIRNEVRKAKSLGEAFAGRAEFSPFYINMIRAGEASGTLEASLTRMSEYLERAKALRKMIGSALTYPLILLSVAVLSLVFLLAYVVPSFADLFTDMGGQLPAPTRIVMGMGDFMARWWWLVIGCFAGLFYFAKHLFKQEDFREKFDQRVLSWPLAGDLVRNLEITRFSRTLGVLLQGGVPLVAGLAIARETVSNRTLRKELDTAVGALKEGKSLSASLLAGQQFPDLALHMLQVGEETGQLEQMLLKVANLYEDEVGTVTQRLLALLEPVLILSLGVLIAGIIVSILLGILGVNELIG